MPQEHRANRSYRYLTDCVGCGDGEAISEMVDRAREITRETFRMYVEADSAADIEQALGYAGHPAHGLTMAADCYVSYFKSWFRGQPVVFFQHSAIEYIFSPAQ